LRRTFDSGGKDMAIINIWELKAIYQRLKPGNETLFKHVSDNFLLVLNACLQSGLVLNQAPRPLVDDLIGESCPKQTLLGECKKHISGPERVKNIRIKNDNKRICDVAHARSNA